jgi:predicted DNA-binding transcriptional regulator YafY
LPTPRRTTARPSATRSRARSSTPGTGGTWSPSTSTASDWRTFRIDRIRGRLRLGGRGGRRIVPGGDPAAFVKRQIRSSGERGAPAGQILIEAPPEALRRRVPERYATLEAVGDDASLVTTRGPWSPYFLVWMSLLDEPIHVVGPPELVAAARSAAARLNEAVMGADPVEQ